MKLNADLGESFGIWKMGNDAHAMQYIDMANVACGFHASDPDNIAHTLKLAKQHKVAIGAHPSYNDLVGFGRRSIPMSENEIYNLVVYQLGALSAFCKINHLMLDYVKPHGALYNDMMAKEEVFRPIAKAISDFDKSLKIMVLSGKNEDMINQITSESGLSVYREVFLDRGYNDDGSLVKRGTKGDLIGHDDMLDRVSNLLQTNSLQSIEGKRLELKVDTLCVHTDNQESLEILKQVRKIIDAN